MVRWMLPSLLLLLALQGFAQVGFEMTTPLRDYCSPGVRNQSPSKGILFEYGFQPPMALQSYSPAGATHFSNNDQLQVKLKAPLVLKPGLKVLAGISHIHESYDYNYAIPEAFPTVQELDRTLLKATRLSLYAVKPWSQRMYLMLRLEGSFNGDYRGLMSFDRRYAVYRASALWGIKKNEDTEWGVGFLYKRGFRNQALYPFLLFNHTFNDHWGLESVFPAVIKGRYNFDRNNILLFGTELQTSEYSIDMATNSGNGADASSIFHLNSASLLFSLAYNRRVNRWTWTEFKVGYSHSLSSNFENTATGELLPTLPTNGPFVSFSVFLSPPRDR